MRKALPFVLMLLTACGGPQAEDETAVTYRAKFKTETTAKVIFPFPTDLSASEIEQGLQLGDRGRLVTTNEGIGLELSGAQEVEVKFAGTVKTLGKGDTIPDAQLSRQLPDAATTERYFQVNKGGGSALINIEFEYSATRDCGGQCGGSRSWKYTGPVGLSVQQISVEFTESTR